MTERATIFEHVQIGAETVPGTAVPANKLLAGLSISPSPDGNINLFRPQGTKYKTVSAKGKEFTTADLEGLPTYGEMVYYWASIGSKPVTTTPSGGTISRQHVITPAVGAPDDPLTLTVEAGSSLRAMKFPGGIINELGMSFSREEIGLDGSMFGKALQDGIAMTATPTPIPLQPILPEHFSIFLDPTFGALGTTKLLRWLEGEFRVSDRFGQVWPLDAAQSSYVDLVETEPTIELTLKLEADAAGMALLNALRASSRSFVRIQAIGPLIEAAIPYTFKLDLAGDHSAMPGFDDLDGVYTIEYTMTVMADNAWGKAWEMTFINTIVSL